MSWSNGQVMDAIRGLGDWSVLWKNCRRTYLTRGVHLRYRVLYCGIAVLLLQVDFSTARHRRHFFYRRFEHSTTRPHTASWAKKIAVQMPPVIFGILPTLCTWQCSWRGVQSGVCTQSTCCGLCRAGHLGFAVLQFSSISYLQANLT